MQGSASVSANLENLSFWSGLILLHLAVVHHPDITSSVCSVASLFRRIRPSHDGIKVAL